MMAKHRRNIFGASGGVFIGLIIAGTALGLFFDNILAGSILGVGLALAATAFARMSK